MGGRSGSAFGEAAHGGAAQRAGRPRSTEAFARDAVRYRTAPRRSAGFADALIDAPHRVIVRLLSQKGLTLLRHGAERRIETQGHHRAGCKAALAACLLIAVALLAGGLATCAERVSLAACASVDASAVSTSTPVSEWRQGQMPYLYQTDAAWGDEAYAGGAIAENGCGPTALAMVRVEVLGGTKWDPATLAAWSERSGYVEGGATRWALMTEGAAQLGLSSRELPADATSVRAALQAGDPVVCVVGPGDFTTTGHFIVIASLNADGTVNVHDPNSAANSHTAWDLERILSQTRNLWAFSAG